MLWRLYRTEEYSVGAIITALSSSLSQIQSQPQESSKNPMGSRSWTDPEQFFDDNLTISGESSLENLWRRSSEKESLKKNLWRISEESLMNLLWRISEESLKNLWRISEESVKNLWRISEESVKNLSRICQESVKNLWRIYEESCL